MASSLDTVDFVELRWLLEDKYHLSRVDAIAAVEVFRQTGVVAPEYLEDVEALAKGTPVAYVIGWIDFLGCRIDLSLSPLIPRPETEFWVEQFVDSQRTTKPLRVLDLCCGSGCIGIGVMKRMPNVHVTFVDVEPLMMKQTAQNALANDIPEHRYDLITSDLFSGVSGKFDVILSNPPYVDPFGEISPSLVFEPKQALFAQKQGLALIEQIFLQVKNHLVDNGLLYVEFASDQAERVQDLAISAGLDIRVFQDHFARDRFAICTPTKHI